MMTTSGRKMRILHLLDHIGAGGAQQIVLDIIQNADLDRFDFTVGYFFDRHHLHEEYEKAGARVVYFGGKNYRPRNLWDPRLLFRARKFLRASARFDVIHFHLYYSLLAVPLAARMSRYAPRSIVYTMHALRHQLPWYTFPLLKIVSPLIGTFVAEVKLSHEEMVRAGVPEQKIAFIPLGTRYSHWDSTAESQQGYLHSELGIHPSAPIVLNIGRLHKAKGQDLLIEAAARVVPAVPNCVFLIVGDGEEEAELRRLVMAKSLESKVIFTGYRRDLSTLYEAADVVAVSSVQEGIGIVTLDSLAWGKPVVAFNVGALGEVVRSGETGFLVRVRDVQAFADALIYCLTHLDRAKAMGRKGRDLVRQQYSLSALVSAYEHLYASIRESETVRWIPA